MALNPSHFAAFHRAVHGTEPFAWQVRLLRQVTSQERWPRVLDLPTGVGKTSCIDIALFALAMDARRPPAERWCARRIAMVVDRRLVVDQVAARGRKLLAALTSSDEPVVVEVSEALNSLTGGEEEPLAVYTLRGGIPKDDGWARTPHQPLVLASTVDQLGSRLFMQGYGVTDGMRPVHAGLLANDTLLLLDEVHLSRPFAQSLEAAQRLRSAARRADSVALRSRFEHVFLSATPGSASVETFSLEKAECAPASALGPRLHARKPVSLHKVGTREQLIAQCARLARELLLRHTALAVVVNRVSSARSLVQLLRSELNEGTDVVLLTGRMRPLDRDDALTRWLPRIGTGRDRCAQQDKLIVVGTQCIEAGADFDFDALISECASLDALRQRMGRVDRIGSYGLAEAHVVHAAEESGVNDDPVYGKSMVETWRWLNRQKKELDFGIAHLSLPEDVSALLAPQKQAPVLLPAYLDLWAQTSPAPAVVPDVALFLHGPEAGPADVQVVWRADIGEGDLRPERASALAAIVASVRPTSLEAVSVPLYAAKAWLRGQPDAGFADVDAARTREDFRRDASAPEGRRALRWRGADSEVVGHAELRPGDTLVVPCTRGGLRDGSFDPDSAEPVSDLAERAALLARGRAVLRLHPAVLEGLALPVELDADDVGATARAAQPGETVPWRQAWLATLGRRLRRSVVGASAGHEAWVVLEGDRLQSKDLRRALGAAAQASIEVGAENTTDEEDSFDIGQGGITLAQHSTDVESVARRYADALGLPSALANDLALAAWLHDVGKADPRFQLLLRAGDEIGLLKDPRPWAKSVLRPADRVAQSLARERSCYPAGARHEVMSVAMIEAIRPAALARAQDPELVLHLVASHHGHCRPFAPAAPDSQPVEVSLAEHASATFGRLDFPVTSSDHQLHRLGSPLADRFWRLVERYGWFELCWLECVLRLADHRASEAEEVAR